MIACKNKEMPKPKNNATVPCVVCGKLHVPSPFYQGKKSKCADCRTPPNNDTWDRWANGNEFGSFNSDDD